MQTVTLTYADVRGILAVLDNEGEGLAHSAEQPMKAVVLPLMRTIRKLEEQVGDFREAAQKLVERFLDGPAESQEQLEELEQNQEFQQEYGELLRAEIEVEVAKIDPEDLVGVSAATLLSIAPLLAD